MTFKKLFGGSKKSRKSHQLRYNQSNDKITVSSSFRMVPVSPSSSLMVIPMPIISSLVVLVVVVAEEVGLPVSLLIVVVGTAGVCSKNNFNGRSELVVFPDAI